jgi:hypothetical protein
LRGGFHAAPVFWPFFGVFLANMKFETLMKTAQKATQKTAKKPQRETPYFRVVT